MCLPTITFATVRRLRTASPKPLRNTPRRRSLADAENAVSFIHGWLVDDITSEVVRRFEQSVGQAIVDAIIGNIASSIASAAKEKRRQTIGVVGPPVPLSMFFAPRVGQIRDRLVSDLKRKLGDQPGRPEGRNRSAGAKASIDYVYKLVEAGKTEPVAIKARAVAMTLESAIAASKNQIENRFRRKVSDRRLEQPDNVTTEVEKAAERIRKQLHPRAGSPKHLK